MILIRQEGCKQAFYSNLNNFIKGRQGSKKLLVNLELNDSFTPYLSIRYVSSKLRISSKTTIKLIHHLNYDKQIRTTFDGPEFVMNCGSSDLKYLEGIHGYKYNQEGSLYCVQPARHEFLTDPIKSRRMTLKSYRRAVKDPQVRKYVDKLNLILSN